MVTVRAAEAGDADTWFELRRALWPECCEGEHRGEIERLFAGEFPRGPWVVLVAEDDDGGVLEHFPFSSTGSTSLGDTSNGEKPRGLKPAARNAGVGNVLGFAELSLRPYAEGCQSSPVAYLEGWFVVPEGRRRGVGRALVGACETWGRSRGCTEFASDAEADNDVSAAAHASCGFTDVGMVRCFRKEL